MANKLSKGAASNLKTPTGKADASESEIESNQGDSVDSDSGNKTSTGGTGGKEDDSDSKLDLARKETAQVFKLRMIVFLVMLLAAITVCCIIYLIMAKGEKEEYESQFLSAAEKFRVGFRSIVEVRLSAISSLGVAIIAHGRDHATQVWPYVTLSSFQERASTARKQSGVLYVQINPEVQESERLQWEIFSAIGSDGKWIDDGMDYQDAYNLHWIHSTSSPRNFFRREAPWPIWYFDSKDEAFADDSSGPVFPTWQHSPILYEGLLCNENIRANKDGLNSGANITFTSKSVTISQLISAPPGSVDSSHPSSSLFALYLSAKKEKIVEYPGDPISRVYFPIYDDFNENRTTVAIMMSGIRWADYFENILPSTMKGINLVLNDSCGGTFTYLVRGQEVYPIGEGDLHDSSYSHMEQKADFVGVKNIADGTRFGLPFNSEHCPMTLSIYPADEFYNEFNTKAPEIMTMAVGFVFVFTVVMFVCYDRLVEHRQQLVMRKAEQTSAVVNQLFPSNVRDRLLQENSETSSNYLAPKRRLKGYLDGGEEDEIDTTPIADLFPHCTVMFCDIAGFTAWSSTREPAQVFILLQTIYQAFDKIAKRRKVFKVETIGDSYVAVTGLPEAQAAHAIIMARFASECRDKFNDLTARLENTLGPDTADLSMRFGLHSGPVTAGVLRGDRARFQLFGDTVNTAARMESTGMRNRVHISEATYEILVASGKQAWVKPRADRVEAKGKGIMKTYWCETKAKASSSNEGSSATEEHSLESHEPSLNGQKNDTPRSRSAKEAKLMAEKQERLVNWIVDMLHDHIRKVVAMRKSMKSSYKSTHQKMAGRNTLDEVAEAIILPRFDAQSFAESQNYRSVDIGKDVLDQLHNYISKIASLYRDNPFHNFEHACHVTMATNKLLTRIVAPDIACEKADEVASALHAYTHGINSDPLTIMAIVFSALIHDVDHRGVSNAQLAVEDKEMADKYQNKSIAEQHSLDLGWEIFMEPQFELLRETMFASEADFKRFRQVLVNVVLATDIFDKELNDLRKKRWSKAFSEENISHEETNDLRATIVIEHIIQASDVSHTMQHWHIYRKWNKRLFTEMYEAYRAGRMAKDPSTFWYKGELGFFDNYIIPLAKKLKDCNVFGVSSDECLNYALQNRNEWEDKGAAIVDEMMSELAMEEENDEEGEVKEQAQVDSLLGSRENLNEQG